jgi:hypothetical protein
VSLPALDLSVPRPPGPRPAHPSLHTPRLSPPPPPPESYIRVTHSYIRVMCSGSGSRRPFPSRRETRHARRRR